MLKKKKFVMLLTVFRLSMTHLCSLNIKFLSNDINIVINNIKYIYLLVLQYGETWDLFFNDSPRWMHGEEIIVKKVYKDVIKTMFYLNFVNLEP